MAMQADSTRHLELRVGYRTQQYPVFVRVMDKDSRCTEAYKGHCVLCNDALSFVFQTFDFQVLCSGFCVCVLCC